MEYSVVLPIVPMREGSRYAPEQTLPLHCAVLHWFRASAHYTGEQLKAHVELISKETKQLTLVYAGPEMTISQRDASEHLLQQDPELLDLHARLLELIPRAAALHDFRRSGDRYRPCLGGAGGLSFNKGAQLVVSSLALIERDALKRRRVVAIFSLARER